MLIRFGDYYRRSATATVETLDAVVERASVLNPVTGKILGVLNPLANCLLKNEGFEKFEAAGILCQLRGFLQ